MFTRKQITDFISRVVALGAFSVGYSHSDIQTGLLVFGSLCCSVWLTPWLVSRLVLNKNQQDEVDGEISLLSTNNNSVEYYLSVDEPMSIPYKDKLTIRVNENVKILTGEEKED